MPVYEFVCDSCKFHGFIEQSIKKSLPKKCPDCKSKDPDFHQIFGNPFLFCRPEITTVGQQAELNAKKAGREQIQIMAEKAKVGNHKGKFSVKTTGKRLLDKCAPKRPWWRPNSDKPLDVKQIPDVKRYIEEGKK